MTMRGNGTRRAGGSTAFPQDQTRLKLRYDAVCSVCQMALPRGRWAHWSRSAKRAWCLDCGPSPKPPSHRTVSEPALPTAEVGRQAAWQQLCDYTRLCLEAEAADGIERFANKQRTWWRHGGSFEGLIVGTAESVAAPQRLVGTFAGTAADELPQFVYGWPTLVFPGERRYDSVAPLFRVTVEPERTPDGRWILNAVTEPEFNTALASVARFDRATVDHLADELDEGIPFGDEASLVTLANDLAARLDVDVRTAPEPARLNGYLTRRDGLYNCAVTIKAKGQYLGGVIRELRLLRDKTDWPETAAAFLLRGTSENLRRSSDTVVVSPITSNYSQEDALERLSVDPITVITGPPGTGKTQLVVNAVSDAWARDETILVTSVNNAAVDVPTERATDAVCPGLLLRTGNRDARESVAQQVHEGTTWATEQRRSHPAAARDAHETVTTSRRRFLDNLAELSQIDTQLIPLTVDVEEKRRRAETKIREIWGDRGPDGVPPLSRRDERRIPKLEGRHLLARRAIRRMRAKYRLQPDTPLLDLLRYAEAEEATKKATDKLDISEGRRGGFE